MKTKSKQSRKINVYLSDEELEKVQIFMEALPFKPSVSEVCRRLLMDRVECSN